MIEPVRHYLEKDAADRLAPLMELLRFPSMAGDPAAADRCARWLVDYLEGLGSSSTMIETAGRPCVFGSWETDPDLPTLLVYGHYDVQPPDPLEEWHSDPFEPVVRDGMIYARGADDDKGQFFIHLLAVEALTRVHGRLPVNLKILLEGEEEIGSPNMESLIAAQREMLSADSLVISDGSFFSDTVPSILSGLRGLCTFEVRVRGPARDLHSGIAGGAVRNPVNALCRLVGLMHDADGRVTLPGFYDDVENPDAVEVASWGKLAFDPAAHARSCGVDVLAGGEKAYGPLERMWSRPTLDCNGIAGGYQDAGDKTIIPSRASVKLSTRLVPRQKPAAVAASLERFVEQNTPAGIESTVVRGAAVRPVLLDIASPAVEAGKKAMAEAFGAEPVFVRCGGSVPITEMFQRIMGLDAVMLGVGLPGDNLHAPNEHIPVRQVLGGAVMSASYMMQLGAGGV